MMDQIWFLEQGGGHLDAAITSAFPGCALEIQSDNRGLLSLGWRQAGIHRLMDVRELSDGTLRFLCLAAALLTPQPPSLLVLNEPESSLHPALLPALADLIAQASQHCQVLVTTHAGELAQRIAALTGYAPVTLEFSNGQTKCDQSSFLGQDT
jgi:predicted ATPase